MMQNLNFWHVENCTQQPTAVCDPQYPVILYMWHLSLQRWGRLRTWRQRTCPTGPSFLPWLLRTAVSGELCCNISGSCCNSYKYFISLDLSCGVVTTEYYNIRKMWSPCPQTVNIQFKTKEAHTHTHMYIYPTYSCTLDLQSQIEKKSYIYCTCIHIEVLNWNKNDIVLSLTVCLQHLCQVFC